MNVSDKIIALLNQNYSKLELFGVEKIALFGSYIRNEQNKMSDIDILVEFKECEDTFDNYMDLKYYLEELFNKKVDLVIFSTIKKALKNVIMESLVYAKGA